MTEPRRAQILLKLIGGRLIRRSWRGDHLTFWLEGVDHLKEVEVWEMRHLLEPFRRGRALFPPLRLRGDWWGIAGKL